MFGYIQPDKPELKIKEYELYRAYYCGICREIGRKYGQAGRLALNYDSAFIAVLVSSLSPNEAEIERKRCPMHPLEKRCIAVNSDVLDYVSDIDILLAYHVLNDNWRDERSVLSRTGMMILKKAFKKVCARYSQKCENVTRRLCDLEAIEKARCRSMDEAAEPCAKIMEEAVAYPPLCDGGNDEKALRWIGYNTGKWVYLIDACDDLEKDAGSGCYNPVLSQFGYTGGDIGEFRKSVHDRMEFVLTQTLSQIARAYELAEAKTHRGLVENIIYMGMLKKTDQVLNARSCKDSEKSV